MNEQNKQNEGGTRSVASEELQKLGAKIKACNERSYARMAEINRIASETLVKTTHVEYKPGQYGNDYRAFGKAMCEIRKLVRESVFDVSPDYEMLAKQFARPGFDADKLATAIEALASEQPIDYPTFYTLGWLVDLAKKIEAEQRGDKNVAAPAGGAAAARGGDIPVADHETVTEVPAVSGCPSLGQKVFPSGADGTEPAAITKSSNPYYEFYGLKLNRFGGAGLGVKLIGKRVNVDKSVQVFEIDLKRGTLATGARATVTENGEMLFTIVGGMSFPAVEHMAISALHSLLKRRHDRQLRRKRRRAAKRAAANQAIINKELA